MKKQIIVLLLSLLGVSIFAEKIQYKVLNNVKCEDFNTKNTIEIQKNTILSYDTEEPLGYHMNYFSDTSNDVSEINFLYNGEKISLKKNDIELCNENCILKNNSLDILLISEYFLTYIKNKDFSYILDKEPYWKNQKKLWDSGKLSFEDKTFYDDYSLPYINMNNLMLQIADEWILYLIKHVEYNDNIYSVDLFRRHSFRENSYYPENYLKYADQHELKLFFEFDGDYVDIWVNSKNEPMGRYYAITPATYQEIRNLIRSGNCDSSKIYWPRHADGTSDFDKEIKSPMVKLADNSAVASESKPAVVPTGSTTSSTPTTNVSVKKLMTTNCNLKLRAAEATSSNVLTVMAQGTKVKILELGKAETIDGISSNWVKVEVQKGAKDRDGKAIAPKTTGWCYGGYLE